MAVRSAPPNPPAPIPPREFGTQHGYSELILQSIDEGVHGIDTEGRVTFVNRSAAAMLGWTPQDLVGKPQHALIHHSRADGTPHPDSECSILAAIREGRVVRQDGDVFWRKDGSSLPVDYIATPLRQGGITIGAVIVFRDITDRQHAATQLEEDHEKATQSLSRINRELDQFAYVASHDLKAPLRGISSLASWIEDDLGPKLGDESRQHLGLLRSRVTRMETLIDGLLQYSRAGRVRNRIETVDVAALLDEVLEMLDPPPQATMEIAPGMPTLATERVPLLQVFQNLLGNALKHSGRPDVTVRVSVRDDGDCYEFSISDNGAGIPPQFHSKVWEMFQTLQPRDKVEGAGMGLALVKKNVENRGGTAWLESDGRESDGRRGAVFSFTWPKHMEQDSNE